MTFQSKDKAEKGLCSLLAIASNGGLATVADLYDVADRDNSRPNIDYGWYHSDLMKGFVEEFNGKGILRLPNAKRIR